MTFDNYLIRGSYISITSNPVEQLEEDLKIKFQKHEIIPRAVICYVKKKSGVLWTFFRIAELSFR
jgi:hypothetical protein